MSTILPFTRPSPERPARDVVVAPDRDTRSDERSDIRNDARNDARRDATIRPRERRDDRDAAPARDSRRPAAGRTSATRSARDLSTAREDDDATDSTAVAAPSTPFASLLALLAQTGTTPAPTAPDTGVSFVDALMQQGDADRHADSGATTPQGTAAQNTAATTSAMASAQEAGDALRYGILKLVPREAPVEQVTHPVLTPPSIDPPVKGALTGTLTDVSTGTPIGAPTDLPGSRRAGTTPTDAPVATEAMDRSHALEAIARLATRRGSTVEQLMALNDARGAAAKQSLDSLLDAAGTPAGARLAARQLLSASTRAILGGGEATGAGATTNAMASLEALKIRLSRTGDVTTPTRDLTGVAPALQEKLQRVVDRMKQEFGHDVTIVETTRTQERQDWLYEQGRTRPGVVVTWTRESAHTRGGAVDVKIDGTFDNPEGFARLQQIAKEEGLRTLGMRDPGHLELPGSSAEAMGGLAATAPGTIASRDGRALPESAPTASAASARGVARVAGVAGVAGIAGVAASAPDARSVASAADGSSDRTGDRTGDRKSDRTGGNALASAAGLGARGTSSEEGRDAGSEGDAKGRDGRRSTDAANRGRANGKANANADANAPELRMADTAPGQSTSGAHTGRAGGVHAAAAAAGSHQAERVADIQQMRADAPATPLSRMTLDVEGADGQAERITIGVRGTSVNAHIATDADTADRLRLRTADLQDALGRHGLDGDSVRISATSRANEAGESARMLGSERDALRLATTGASAQDGAAANGQQQGRASREWNQDDARREQAARARDERQQRSRQDAEDQQERQRRQTLFTGNAS